MVVANTTRAAKNAGQTVIGRLSSIHQKMGHGLLRIRLPHLFVIDPKVLAVFVSSLTCNQSFQ
jgi:hypothetical protein